MAKSVFTKIIDRELPAKIIFEDDDFIVIDNIDHKAPVHVLIIPKKNYPSLEKVAKDDHQFHARLLELCREMAEKLNIQDNYKLHLNVGSRVQQVQHLHFHLLGGWKKTDKVQHFL